MDLKARAKKLKTDIPAIFLSLKDKDSPLLAKIFAGITVGYALSPVDLIPDFIPVLGYRDCGKVENLKVVLCYSDCSNLDYDTCALIENIFMT